MKCRYAKRRNETLVDIFDLNELDRNSLFTCVSCGHLLIPKMGLKKTWHFAHKSQANCNSETYLHHLAKTMFFQKYKMALQTHQPIYIELPIFIDCNRFQSQGFVCEAAKIYEKLFDLTAFFDQVQLEKGAGPFIADVLLSSSKHKEVVLVEFEVTHACSPEKLASNYRIIDILIENEDDVKKMFLEKDGKTQLVENKMTEFYNFKDMIYMKDVCRGDCPREEEFFVIYSSQRSALVKQTFGKATKLSKEDGVYVEWVGRQSYPPGEKYKALVRKAYFEKRAIKNCLLCKYHGLNQDTSTFCLLHKKQFSSNRAIKCQEYRPMKTPRDFALKDKRNEDYKKLRGL